MKKKWFTYINACLGLLCVLLMLLAFSYLLIQPDEQLPSDVSKTKKTLPKGSFVQKNEAYQALDKTIFSLKYAPMTVQLPDLRKYLVYYGKNDRPDAKNEKPLLHFGFVGNKTPTSILPLEKTYILYDKNLTPPQYIFSPNNETTPLYIEVSAVEKEATIKVRMKNEEGIIIQEPWAHAQFTTIQKDFIRTATPWEIGKWKVDGSLLARQKTKWYGTDRFIENHGGDELAVDSAKQRLDFGEGEDTYSVFLGTNQALIWVNDRWKVTKPGLDSLGFPLLMIKKIDDRLMQLELWDALGQAKIILNLLKSNTPWDPQTLMLSFKFMGSHTRSQFVFEVDKERMLLSPKDWLVHTQKGWKKLNSATDVDDYVNRKIIGELFVFDGIIKKGDQQYITGILYNASRSDAKPIEIPISPSPIGRRKSSNEERNGPQLEKDSPEIPPSFVHYPTPSDAQLVPPKKFDQEKDR